MGLERTVAVDRLPGQLRLQPGTVVSFVGWSAEFLFPIQKPGSHLHCPTHTAVNSYTSLRYNPTGIWCDRQLSFLSLQLFCLL